MSQKASTLLGVIQVVFSESKYIVTRPELLALQTLPSNDSAIKRTSQLKESPFYVDCALLATQSSSFPHTDQSPILFRVNSSGPSASVDSMNDKEPDVVKYKVE